MTAIAFQATAEASDLVEAHLAGDADAFSQLDRMYRPRLLNFLHRMVRDRARAEDLVQETFLRVHRFGHRFDRTRSFSTWIYTIAANLARNDLRQMKRRPLVLSETSWVPGVDRDPVLQVEDPAERPDVAESNRNLRELVERTARRLSPIHRQVFELRELESKSYEEIADIVGCDLGTVKSRLNRARRAFAGMIAPHLDAAGHLS